MQLLQAITGAEPSPVSKTPLVALGDFLFAHTGGQPLYLLETLKLFRDRQWLVPRLSANGTWGLEPLTSIDFWERRVRKKRQAGVLC